MPIDRTVGPTFFALCGVLCGCTDPGGSLDGLDVIAKCRFGATNDPVIERGEVFAHVLQRDDGLVVVTGVADVRELLLVRDVAQTVDVVHPARIVGAERVEFGGLAEDGSGTSDHFLGIARTGEARTSVGTTYGTDRAYPLCVGW